MQRPIISLMTDFGLKDGNVGVIKGVILGIAKDAQIVDISHQIQPQDILEASLILSRSAPYFPDESIHVIVVDPGVGTQRQPIAVRLGKHLFVCPDNGILTHILDSMQDQNHPIKAVCLNQTAYWLPHVSHVFHGRDIFAPVAAHLAMGVSLDRIGSPIHTLVELDLPKPTRHANRWSGEVIHIDHFGNVSTNIRREELANVTKLVVEISEKMIPGLFKTFGERHAGELIALFGSTDYLIISKVNGNAAEDLGIRVGSPVDVFIVEPIS